MRKKVVDILNEHSLKQPPIDVESIAQSLGINIVRQNLDEGISAVLVVKNDRAIMGLNASHSRRRQRFSIGHEIGHFLFHVNGISTFIDHKFTFHRDRNSATGEYRQEMEANAFAAELLMPERMVAEQLKIHDLDVYDEISIPKLASIFDVSEQAITIRLTNLKNLLLL